jgi:hypothetical protein
MRAENDNKIACGLHTVWRVTYVTRRNQSIDEYRDDGLGAFQAL